jgi:hypothetical protein
MSKSFSWSLVRFELSIHKLSAINSIIHHHHHHHAHHHHLNYAHLYHHYHHHYHHHHHHHYHHYHYYHHHYYHLHHHIITSSPSSPSEIIILNDISPPSSINYYKFRDKHFATFFPMKATNIHDAIKVLAVSPVSANYLIADSQGRKEQSEYNIRHLLLKISASS